MNAILVYVRVLYAFTINKHVGALIRVVQALIKDVLVFLLFFILLLLGFTLAFAFFFRAEIPEQCVALCGSA